MLRPFLFFYFDGHTAPHPVAKQGKMNILSSTLYCTVYDIRGTYFICTTVSHLDNRDTHSTVYIVFIYCTVYILYLCTAQCTVKKSFLFL